MQALLQRRINEREAAIRKRDETFSVRSMKYIANTAAVGLSLGNLDELRAMKFTPPPIVQLVVRCVCTLVSGDDIGDAEAQEAAALARRPRSARGAGAVRSAHSVQGRLQAAQERLQKSTASTSQILAHEPMFMLQFSVGSI